MPKPVFKPRGSSHPESVFNLPPKKVIRATDDYTAKYAQELTFKRGDFFYVIGGREGYYEVINPVARVRGIVPIGVFESMDKNLTRGLSAPPPARTSMGGSHTGGGMARVNEDDGDTKEDFITNVTIPSIETKDDGKAYYLIQVLRSSGFKNILHRTYDDLWILHLSLLNAFPAESGRPHNGKVRSRILPFLATPPAKQQFTKTQLNNKKRFCEKYLQTLVALPPRIMDSAPAKRFFAKKTTDIETQLEMVFESGDTLIDLIEEYGLSSADMDNLVPVRICIDPDTNEFAALKVPSDSSYNDLVHFIERDVGFGVKRMAYVDETNELVELRSDKDLKVLLETCEDIVFYVLEQ